MVLVSILPVLNLDTSSTRQGRDRSGSNRRNRPRTGGHTTQDNIDDGQQNSGNLVEASSSPACAVIAIPAQATPHAFAVDLLANLHRIAENASSLSLTIGPNQERQMASRLMDSGWEHCIALMSKTLSLVQEIEATMSSQTTTENKVTIFQILCPEPFFKRCVKHCGSGVFGWWDV